MQAYISTLLISLSPSPGPPSTPTTKTHTQIYTTSLSSPLLSHAHLALLAKHTHNYLTPGQTPPLAQSALEMLGGICDAFLAAHEKAAGKKNKKRKTASSIDKKGDADADELAIQLALMSRILGSILPALPLNNLTASARQSVHELLRSTQAGLFRPSVVSLLGSVTEQGGDRGDGWAAQVATSALLRLEYALVAARPLGLSCNTEGADAQRMLELVEGEKELMLPELSLEIVRSFIISP